MAMDGGWGWAVVFGVFINFVIMGGLDRAFGIWYVEILARFDSSAALSVWVNGLNNGLRLLLAPVATELYHRWSPQIVAMLGSVLFAGGMFVSAFVENIITFIIVYGVIGGFGGALSYLPAYVLIAEYFERYRNLAYAIVFTGSGIGSLLYSVLFSTLFASYSYFETVTIMSGVTLHLLPAAALFILPENAKTSVMDGYQGHRRLASSLAISHNQRTTIRRKSIEIERQPLLNKAKGVTTKKHFPVHLFINPLVLLVMLIAGFNMLSTSSYLTLVVDFSIERGLSESTGSMIPTVCGATEVVFRLSTGLMFQIVLFRPYALHMWFTFTALLGAAALLTTFCYELWQFILAAILNTGAVGGFYSIAPVVIGGLFVDDVYPDVIGLYCSAQGVGFVVGALAAGAIKDATGKYEASYYAMTAYAATACIVTLIVAVLSRCFRRSGRYHLRPPEL